MSLVHLLMIYPLLTTGRYYRALSVVVIKMPHFRPFSKHSANVHLMAAHIRKYFPAPRARGQSQAAPPDAERQTSESKNEHDENPHADKNSRRPLRLPIRSFEPPSFLVSPWTEAPMRARHRWRRGHLPRGAALSHLFHEPGRRGADGTVHGSMKGI